MTELLVAALLPTSWARGRPRTGAEDGEDLFDDEEGEDMVGFDMSPRRRAALDRRRGGEGEHSEARRLSRDLEEGFRDDSSNEDEDGLEVGEGRGRE